MAKNQFLFLTTIMALLHLQNVAGKRAMPKVMLTLVGDVRTVECQTSSPKFFKFMKCGLETDKSMAKSATVHVALLDPPARTANIRISTLKLNQNIYQPFIYNFTSDFCKYLKTRKNYFVDWLFTMVQPYTNVNHSCPYYHDMIIQKFPVDNIRVPSLFTVGEYSLNLIFEVNGMERFSVQIFVNMIKL